MNKMDRRGFLKAMLVLAGSVMAPSLVGAGPRESVYVPKLKTGPVELTKDLRFASIVKTNGLQFCKPISQIWVAPEGSDIMGLGTRDQPFRTLGYAVQAVKPGDIVHVNPVVYRIP